MEFNEPPTVSYVSESTGAGYFVRVCPKCGRYVKADDTIQVNDSVGVKPGPNATCSKCGRVKMPFLGFY